MWIQCSEHVLQLAKTNQVDIALALEPRPGVRDESCHDVQMHKQHVLCATEYADHLLLLLASPRRPALPVVSSRVVSISV